jgi:hypothetical protein
VNLFMAETEQSLFCQAASERVQRLWEDWGDDPRSAYGADAIYQLEKYGKAVQPLDARSHEAVGETFDVGK